MNDPRGILEEFAERAVAPSPVAEGLDHNMEPEHLRARYRTKQESLGLCRSCTMNAKPGRKYCLTHLARANERARRSALANASP